MPTRKRPFSPAERQRSYRQRQREGSLHTAGDVPLHVAEGLVDVEVLPKQDASDPRALFDALIRASERYVKKNRDGVTHKDPRAG